MGLLRDRCSRRWRRRDIRRVRGGIAGKRVDVLGGPGFCLDQAGRGACPSCDFRACHPRRRSEACDRKSLPQDGGARSSVAAAIARGVTRSSRASPEPSDSTTSPSAIPAVLRKCCSNLEPFINRANSGLFTRDRSQEDFRVEVLADLVRQTNAFDKRRRNMFRKHERIRARSACSGRRTEEGTPLLARTGGGACCAPTPPVTRTPRSSSNCFSAGPRFPPGPSSRNRERPAHVPAASPHGITGSSCPAAAQRQNPAADPAATLSLRGRKYRMRLPAAR